MTREEAIKIFGELLLFGKASCKKEVLKDLCKTALTALEQEPKNEVLDKIKEDIQFIKDKCLPNTIAEEYEQKGLQEALDIIDRYKAESENP